MIELHALKESHILKCPWQMCSYLICLCTGFSIISIFKVFSGIKLSIYMYTFFQYFGKMKKTWNFIALNGWYMAFYSTLGEWKKKSGESRQLATSRLKEKLIWKIINNGTNSINSTSGSITCLSLFSSRRSETQHECVNLLQQRKVLKTCRSAH